VALSILSQAVAGPALAEEGVVKGKVRVMARGPEGAPAPKEDHSGVVVYLTGFEQPPPPEAAVVRQRFKSFILPEGRSGASRALPITRGQKINFVNDDDILHNVFSSSKARTFDLGKKGQREEEAVGFGQTGLVDIFCDIHEQMAMTVLVLPNRAFAITGKDGSFELKGVPPGRWTLRAWLRWAEGPAEAQVTVPGEGAVELQVVESSPDPAHLDKRGRPYSKRSEAYQRSLEKK
jgi:hypothetical protein